MQPGRAGTANARPGVASHAGSKFSFHELLSDLNPLQYIPVIGTLFRAITGDTIPASLRDTGSLLVSGLVAGPIGVALNLGELAVEKVTGIDPEKIAVKVLARIGVHAKTDIEVAAAKDAPTAVTQPSTAWSPAQLAAYGVTTTATDDLRDGGLEGSDVLNMLELDKIRAEHAVLQYAATSANAPS